jgi:multidrug efflux pump subunit AcrA (membrane-fusion protein)
VSHGRSILRAAICVACLAGVAAAFTASRPSATAAIEPGEVHESIVARAMIAPIDGVARVRPENVGRIVRISANVGDTVEPKQVLAVEELLAPKGKDKDKDPETSDIKAPVHGTILSRRVEIGDTVGPGSEAAPPAFEIADLTRTELRIEIEEDDAPRVVVGLPVTARYPGTVTEVARGHVSRLGPRFERRALMDDPLARADGSVRVAWVEWDGARPNAPLGQRLDATIALPPRKVALLAPRKGVHVRDGRAVVDAIWLLWTHEVPVEIGAVDEDSAELQGLEAGTRIALGP